MITVVELLHTDGFKREWLLSEVVLNTDYIIKIESTPTPVFELSNGIPELNTDNLQLSKIYYNSGNYASCIVVVGTLTSLSEKFNSKKQLLKG